MPGVIDPFHRALRQRLEEQLTLRKDTLCANMAQDIEQYRFQCGVISTLTDVLETCREVEAELYVEQKRDE